jgi:hypothetical protein
MRRRWLLALGAVAALLAVNAVLLLAGSSLALPSSLANYFLGPKMVRAEVFVMDGGVQYDYRLDQGRVRGVGPSSISLHERDGTNVNIPVSLAAQVKINGKPATLAAVRRGMYAVTIRNGSAPADRVIVTVRR